MFGTKLPVPSCVQCNNIWITRSYDPPWLIGTVTCQVRKVLQDPLNSKLTHSSDEDIIIRLASVFCLLDVMLKQTQNCCSSFAPQCDSHALIYALTWFYQNVITFIMIGALCAAICVWCVRLFMWKKCFMSNVKCLIGYQSEKGPFADLVKTPPLALFFFPRRLATL